MFALFFSLYYSMFTGSWRYFSSIIEINDNLKPSIDALGTFITSIFGDTPYNTLGTDVFSNIATSSGYVFSNIMIVAWILALITSIGIVVMAVKGVKKAFGIFFMGIRR